MPLLSFELLKSHNWVFSFAGFVDCNEKFVFLCFFPPSDSVFITTKMVGSELLRGVVPYINFKTTDQVCQMRSLWPPPPPSCPSFIAFVRKEWKWDFSGFENFVCLFSKAIEAKLQVSVIIILLFSQSSFVGFNSLLQLNFHCFCLGLV